MLFLQRALLLGVVFVFNNVTGLFAQNVQPDSTVFVLPQRVAAPADAKVLGHFTLGNNTTDTHCDYEQCVIGAKAKARAMGGNLVKITELIAPSFIGKCYKIKAEVLYAPHVPVYAIAQSNTAVQAAAPPPAAAGYALLYVYHLADTVVLTAGYDVHLKDDSVLCHVKGRCGFVVKLYKGHATIWASNESKRSVNIDVLPGRSYFLRCGMVKGEVRGVPVLEIVPEAAGTAEYDKIAKRKQKDVDVRYLEQVH
jgi:hypothetical protein